MNLSPSHLLDFTKSMQVVVDSIRFIDSQVDQFHIQRKQLHKFYATGLTYKQINDLKITKTHLCPYFSSPKTKEQMQPNQKIISISWRDHPEMSRLF